MKRTIININEELCNGCGLCVEGCHEGALQMVDGKARIISDLYCDGLGACIPECPVGAITLEEREAAPYDEIKVMERISPKGENTVVAHLNHLVDHNQLAFVEQGIAYIKEHNLPIDLNKIKPFRNPNEMKKERPASDQAQQKTPDNTQDIKNKPAGGCPGSRVLNFSKPDKHPANSKNEAAPFSELRQWPVQLHLVHPAAPYFQEADVLLAADCIAFSMGNFHTRFLKGKGLAIACPKLDHGKEIYLEKLVSMINDARINTLTVMTMEVPCCTGLMQLARKAAETADRKVPVKSITVSLQGEAIKEEWL